jgi:hypothetical protein
MLIPIGDLLCLVGLAIILRWWQKRYGKLGEKSFALILSGYGSFFVITTFVGIYVATRSNIAIYLGIGFLIILWCIGFPFIRWLVKEFYR